MDVYVEGDDVIVEDKEEKDVEKSGEFFKWFFYGLEIFVGGIICDIIEEDL